MTRSIPALLLVACAADKPTPDLGGDTTGTPTPPTDLQLSYPCPAPPEDAVRIQLGTVLAHQGFYSGTPHIGATSWDPNETSYVPILYPFYALKLRGLSYTDGDSCALLDTDHLYYLDVRRGTIVNQYDIDLQLTIPGDSVDDFLGEHGDGGGHMVRPDRAAHQLNFGWHDGQHYHWVNSLPYGWTRSTVCIGELSPEFTYLTILFDPSDGPYMTNVRNRWTRPLFIEARLVGTGLEEGVAPLDCKKNRNRCRSCFETVYASSTREDWFPSKTSGTTGTAGTSRTSTIK